MDRNSLFFWNAEPSLSLSAAEIARELTYGEEVEGLIDLPIKQILERVKAEFAQHEEQAGRVVLRGGVGSCELTWTWQYLKATLQDFPAGERQKLIDAIEDAGCTAYEPH